MKEERFSRFGQYSVEFRKMRNYLIETEFLFILTGQVYARIIFPLAGV